MKNIELEQELKNIKDDYNSFFKRQDEQSLFYLIQMIELMYTELSNEIENKDSLYNMVNNHFKNNINRIFTNMKDYYLKLTNNSINQFNEIITISDGNKYLNMNNLNNIYKEFENEINSHLNITKKIEVLTNSTIMSLLNEISLLKTNDKINRIANNYKDLITNELIKNVTSKNNFILLNYNKVITSILEEVQDNKQKIMDINLKVLTNTTMTYLQEQEKFIINKYIDDSYNFINNKFNEIETKIKKLSIKKNNNIKINTTKDYLLGFNNTIGVKINKIFEEMNNVINMDGNDMKEKIKEYNDLTSHIYEVNLIFDKQYQNYKKEFNVSSKSVEKFTKMYNEETKQMTDYIKTNISNIFRENTAVLNNILYKYLLLKNKIEDFDEVLTERKVKDLLSK